MKDTYVVLKGLFRLFSEATWSYIISLSEKIVSMSFDADIIYGHITYYIFGHIEMISGAHTPHRR